MTVLLKAKLNPLILCIFVVALGNGISSAQNLEPLKNWITLNSKVHSLYVEFEQERKLRTLRKPISSRGKMWMTDSGKKMRIQTGEPPHSIVVLDGTGSTTVIDTKKKTAEIIRPDKKFGGRASRMSGMFQHLFPKSLDDLQKNFKVLSVEQQQGNWETVLEPLNPDLTGFLNQFVLILNEDGSDLKGFSLRLRDQSEITSRMTRSMKNPKVEDVVFSPSLKGLQVKK